ncbi:hypothetical protein F8503_29130 [Bacillus toyonensis]|nr:hypothetical protein F8503_29130 [Bacillus toyonensis]
MLELSLDESPIHIIKIKVVQVGGRHLRVSFLLYLKKVSTAFYRKNKLRVCKILYSSSTNPVTKENPKTAPG